MKNKVVEVFGEIDIYLFDQLLKGRFDNCKSVFDAGCGYGRNIVYFLKNEYEVYAVDQNAEAVAEVKRLSQELAPRLSAGNFQVSTIEDLPFAANFFDVIICSAVLHFARDTSHFYSMIESLFGVLKPGGYFFARLASNIGIEQLVIELGNGRYLLPDGSERYLVSQEMLLKVTERYGELFEPIKTTNVQNLRCMTTWCVRKT